MLTFPLINDTSRKIIHIDMDAFFASIEERDNPELIGKPVVIARNPLETGGRGVVSTANYIARTYGIHSAMSAKEAYELCPKAIFISGNYDHYKAISHQIHEIFHRYTDEVEGMALDEAYLDVTVNKIGATSAVKIAKLIQHDIFNELHLTSSAGVSYNKFLAKIASDIEKPRGLTLIEPERALAFLSELSIGEFYGVGTKTAEKLEKIGIKTGQDIQNMSPQLLADLFGVFGWELYLKANGIHNSPVKPNRVRKSIGKEKTYGKLLYLDADIEAELEKLAERVAQNLQDKQLKGHIIVLKIRYADFTTLTKRLSLVEKIDDSKTIATSAIKLLNTINLQGKGIRLLGITTTGL
ncbi:DNA polymerase IV [Pseudolactococcus plantarum]|uniref:DNA polymerase IV n=1 Tax=Pseudolactococcus plantarum TaxID=1365 RepID=A0A2A5RX00_9LACT|nr:DNA polymerase IV [Lactococcus plantarum]PCS05724.1 DNA polymerase IV [Lactococcus plantarum]HCN74417.1 DNA polymerase IV [Lactococcus sp.]